MISRLGLRTIVLGYLTVLVLFPVAWVAWKAFGSGFLPAWDAATTPRALDALKLTLAITLIAVAVNTVFGVLTALMVVRHPFRGVSLINALVDLPLGLSPVVVGLCLVLVYGQTGWFGQWLQAHGVSVIYALPGMILATIFVTLPFVVREVVPVVREVGTQQEEAARTLGASALQTFWKITLPAIRAGVIYGVVLTTARALGEFGAVSVVSGGFLQSMTMYVEGQYTNFDTAGAYVTSVELGLLAVLTLLVMNLIHRRGRAR